MAWDLTADELRTLRREAGLTQAYLAEAIGMARETVGQMERGAMLVERRTALAVRWVVANGEPPPRPMSALMGDVADLLDEVMVRGAIRDRHLVRVRHLEDEWKARRGVGIAGALFGLTLGTLGMLREGDRADPMAETHWESLRQIKQQWRSLARSSPTLVGGGTRIPGAG